MPTVGSPQAPATSEIFKSLSFWVSLKISNRKKLQADIVANGGKLALQDRTADYCIVDPDAWIQAPYQCYSYQLIQDSLRAGRFKDPEAYRVEVFSALSRPVGGPAAGRKTTRTVFTEQDDQILYNWVTTFLDKGGKVKGNEIYKQLAEKHPQHPYQSWRSRYIDYVSKRGDPALGQSIPADGTVEARERDHGGRPLKRIRLDLTHKSEIPHPLGTRSLLPYQSETGSSFSQPWAAAPEQAQTGAFGPMQNVAGTPPAPNPGAGQGALESADLDEHESSDTESVQLTSKDAQRQDLSVTVDVRRGLQTSSFTVMEAQRLYKAVPDICNTSPEKLEDAWQNVAEAWTQHTAEEWQTFYDRVILPAYMQRNGLCNQTDLEAHVSHILAREETDPPTTPKIKREPTPDILSPAERQRGAELENAKSEIEDIALSDTLSASPPHYANYTNENDMFISERQPASAAAQWLRSPSTHRADVQANDESKESSQQTIGATSYSAHGEFLRGTYLPKKRLFGQVYHSSQQDSQPTIYSESQPSVPGSDGPAERATASTATAQVAMSSSVSSLSTAQKPSKPFQPPPKSVFTSQELAIRQDMRDTPGQIDGSGKSPVGKDMLAGPVATNREINSVVARAGTGAIDEAGGESHGAVSDTGSEFIAFDTAPERSQIWETAPQDREETDVESLKEVELEGSPKSPGALVHHHQAHTGPRPVSPRPRKELSPVTTDDEYETAGEGDGIYTTETAGKNPAADTGAPTRTETQALFRQSPRNEEYEFNLPSPEGGWGALGFDEVEEADQTHAASSVETLNHKGADQRSLSPPLSEATTSGSSHPEVIRSSRASMHPTQKVYELSSAVDDEETQETTDDEDGQTIRKAPESRTLVAALPSTQERLPSKSGLSAATKDSLNGSSDSAEDGRLSLGKKLKDWMTDQQHQYKELPIVVVQRLASTAAQATCMDITAATLLLRQMVDLHKLAERTRRDLHDRQLQKQQDRRLTSLPFKEAKRLSENEAKALLPDDIPGVWTSKDDQYLLSRTADSVGRMISKHSKDGVKKRARFLRFRYRLAHNTTASNPFT